LAWDEAPRTPRALRETTVDFGERLSHPKQSLKVNPLSATRPKLSTTTRILSSSTDSIKGPSFSLATVHFERPPPSPASPASVSPGTAPAKPSTAPARVVSLERLKALAEPKRRRSKFVRAKSFVGPVAKSKSPRPRLPETETDARRPTSRRQPREPGSEAREHKVTDETKPGPVPNGPTEEGGSLQSTEKHEATEVHGNSVTFSKTEKSERSFDASPASHARTEKSEYAFSEVSPMSNSRTERSEYEFEEVSPASHGKSETSKHGLEDASPTSNSRTAKSGADSPVSNVKTEKSENGSPSSYVKTEKSEGFGSSPASHARTDKSYNTSFVPEEESDAQDTSPSNHNG